MATRGEPAPAGRAGRTLEPILDEGAPAASAGHVGALTSLRPRAGAATPWFKRRATREALAGYLFASPWLIGFFGLLCFPLLLSLYYSFTNYSLLGQTRFVGLANYSALVHDPLVAKSAVNTVWMVAVGLPVGLVVGLILALFMDLQVKGTSLYRTLLYVPAATPVVAGSLLWVWVLNGQGGLLNDILNLIGLGGPNWLGTPQWSKPSIVIMTTWASVGPTTLILVAGLRNIPVHLYEAAVLDGAGRIRRFLHVTVPMLSPTLFFLIVTGLIAGFQVFTQAYVATNGGPVNSTLFYVYYLFNVGFGDFRMGYASALAWLLFIVVILITGIQFWYSKKWVHYDQ